MRIYFGFTVAGDRSSLEATEKRVILFYQRDVEHRLSLLITGNTHPHCTLVCYSGIDEIDALVRKNISPPPRQTSGYALCRYQRDFTFKSAHTTCSLIKLRFALCFH